jgi:glycerol-3-phosphate acyltransferase
MQTVVANLDGTLLRSSSSFPYFMLIAFEAGSPPRALLLLLMSPLVYIFYHFISEAAGISLLIFVSCAGLKDDGLIVIYDHPNWLLTLIDIMKVQ